MVTDRATRLCWPPCYSHLPKEGFWVPGDHSASLWPLTPWIQGKVLASSLWLYPSSLRRPARLQEHTGTHSKMTMFSTHRGQHELREHRASNQVSWLLTLGIPTVRRRLLGQEETCWSSGSHRLDTPTLPPACRSNWDTIT